jgi:hypothetical protein
MSLKSLSNASWRAFAAGLRGMLTWFVPMFLTASATAYISYKYNQRANTELVQQQQRISDLQGFRVSGAELDGAVGRMSDALVDNEGIKQARNDLRNAITRHIADTGSVRQILGENDAKTYIAKLSSLRDVTDNLSSVDSGQPLWEQSLMLMSIRRKMLVDSQARVLT